MQKLFSEARYYYDIMQGPYVSSDVICSHCMNIVQFLLGDYKACQASGASSFLYSFGNHSMLSRPTRAKKRQGPPLEEKKLAQDPVQQMQETEQQETEQDVDIETY